MIRSHVLICGGTGCTSSGSDKIQEAFETELAKAGLSDEIKIVRTGCFGLCAVGPVVIVHPDGTFYSRVQAADVEEIVNEHLLKGRPVKRLEYKDVDETVREKVNVSLNDTTFYKTQKRVALRNCGVIDTDMNRCFSEEELQALIEEIPADRLGQPEEVGLLALKLAESPLYLTGQIITIDGGFL